MDLCKAARDGDTTEVKRLLDGGTDVDARGAWYDAPLHCASKSGHAEVVAILLAAAHGAAEVDIRNNIGSTPLHYASGCPEVVKLLLAAGAEVDARNGCDQTPLHHASENGHSEAVRLLLAATAAHGVHSNTGRTPLHGASAGGHAEVVALLLTAGADVNARDTINATPLHCASTGGHSEAVALLLAAGAKVDARQLQPIHTPHHWCSTWRWPEGSETFAAAEIDAQNGRGSTPLHGACRKGHLNAVKRLLAAGAEVDARNSSGWTPLHYASRYGHAEIVAALLAAGANRYAEDKNGITPGDMAVEEVRTMFTPPVKAAR